MSAALLTSGDVAELAGVKRETIHRYRKRGTLPAPDLTIAGRPVWRRPTIEKWLRTRRGPGRPPKGEK